MEIPCGTILLCMDHGSHDTMDCCSHNGDCCSHDGDCCPILFPYSMVVTVVMKLTMPPHVGEFASRKGVKFEDPVCGSSYMLSSSIVSW